MICKHTTLICIHEYVQHTRFVDNAAPIQTCGICNSLHFWIIGPSLSSLSDSGPECLPKVLRIYTPSRQLRSSSDTCILDGNLRLKQKHFDKDPFYMPTKVTFICQQRSFLYADKDPFYMPCRQRSFLYADKGHFYMSVP